MKLYQVVRVVRNLKCLFKSFIGFKKSEFDRLVKQFTIYLTFYKTERP